MVSVVLALLPVTKGNAVRAAGSSFVFTAAGDYAQTLATTANLQAIAHSGAKFHLALGDFSYSATLSAAQWSNYAKSLLPTNFPFEIIPGDHDRGQLSTDATALPDHLGSTGTYGQQYTFDYPRQAPLVRFIMISPGQTPYNGTTCTSLTTVSYNASCVVNATPAMTKGAGSVIAISGTAGAPMIRISTIDPARGYFRSWEAASSNQT
jgi:hypothetical protein